MMNTSLTSSNRICEKIFTDIITISLTLYKFFQTHQKSAYVLEVLNGLKSASLGLIISAAVTIILLALYGNDHSEMNFLSINWTAVFIFSAMLFILRKWKLNPIIIIFISGIAGFVFYR
ncbi:hypothetical protein D7X48_00170 [bacterium D16-50]|nr:hypothetical protein D7X48_00170 [bacterium D16-50]